MNDSRRHRRPSGRALFHASALTLLTIPLAPEAWSRPQEDPAPMERMQREIDQLRLELQALREQIRALTVAVPPAGGPPPTPGADAGRAAARAAPPDSTGWIPTQATPGRATSPTTFNPAISGVFQAIGSGSIHHDRDEDGFSLSEGEIALQADVDPYARVDLILAFSAEGEAGFEEATVTTRSLPAGLQVKGGRFLSAVGKWNRLHDHQFLSVDRPDALVGFLGDEGLAGDGLSLSWLVPGTGPVYVESISEIASTGNDVSFNARRRDPLFVQHLGSLFTLTDNATLGVGLTGVSGKSGPTEALLEAIDDAGLGGTLSPSGSLASNLFGADVTWKWKPLQRNLYRSLTWQSEILMSRRRAERLDPGGFLARDTVRSAGGYSHFEYQFARRWRAGLRYDATGFPADEGARQRAISAILRIQPSEFQEFRFQFKHTGRNDSASALFDGLESDNEFFIEWIPAIGAHAAHPY